MLEKCGSINFIFSKIFRHKLSTFSSRIVIEASFQTPLIIVSWYISVLCIFAYVKGRLWCYLCLITNSINTSHHVYGINVSLNFTYSIVRSATSEATAFGAAIAAGIASGAWQLENVPPPVSDRTFNPVMSVEGRQGYRLSYCVYMYHFLERQKILTRWKDAVKRCNVTVDNL